MRFSLDTNGNFRTENVVPYALAGDTSGVYSPWTPTVGTHTVGATPFNAVNATGSAGTGLSVSFQVIQ